MNTFVLSYWGNRRKIVSTLQFHLASLGVEVVSPTLQKKVRRGSETVLNTMDKFPGYLFIRVDDLSKVEPILSQIKEVRLLSAIPIRDSELEGIVSSVESIPQVQKGTSITVTEGPLKGYQGIVKGYTGTRLEVLIQVFGREVSVELERDHVREGDK